MQVLGRKLVFSVISLHHQLTIDVLAQRLNLEECLFNGFDPVEADILSDIFVYIDYLRAGIDVLNLLINAGNWPQVLWILFVQVKVLAYVEF